MTLSLEGELQALGEELRRLRRELYFCERAEQDHRVTDREEWLAQLEHRRAYIAVLEEVEASLSRQMEGEEEDG